MNKPTNLNTTNEYKTFITDIKSKITQSQMKIASTVNSALLQFYWELGELISLKQKETKWGSKFIEQMASDLKKEFPSLKGFSRTNLFYIKKFYEFYSMDLVQLKGGLKDKIEETEIVHHDGGLIDSIILQIPWRHNVEIFNKSKTTKEALYYVEQTILNNWGRDTLSLNLKTDLLKRAGNSINNFKTTLPQPQSDLAMQTIKDPYVFDFLTFDKPFIEKDIENKLIDNITKFLLELGKGFAYVGKQYHLEIASQDYYLDLLFYHIELKCYVVIELKNKKFTPEYAGKLNFYISAVDTLLKKDSDNPTIGILLCRDKNNIEVEFALRDINKPIGVSEFELTEVLPENLKSSLPTIQEIEEELNE
ncbi:MAG: PDDEXK nuclease domain-containing protein [Campylobacterota bacterium]|nr:PDDEXK nuclease domain-containing protein [Campylobacterota bacterium]